MVSWRIVGEKTYYVLETEQASANKYGYKGSNQIENPILLENDNKVSEFPKEWITEYTVKDIMDTPWSEDITTLNHKVELGLDSAADTYVVYWRWVSNGTDALDTPVGIESTNYTPTVTVNVTFTQVD